MQGKGLPQQSEVTQGVPGSLRPRIFLTFGTTRVVGRQPYAPAAFTPGWVDPRAHGSVGSYGKNPQWLTPPGVAPEAVRLVAQCHNHYATPGPGIAWSAVQMRDFRLSPPCKWGRRSSGMLHSVDWWLPTFRDNFWIRSSKFRQFSWTTWHLNLHQTAVRTSDLSVPSRCAPR